MGAKLIATVYVRDPDSHDMVRLDAGTEPEARLAALVPNPAAWEDEKPPAAARKTAKALAADTGDEGDTTASATSTRDDGSGDKPATSKRQATSPARGRRAAGEGSSG